MGSAMSAGRALQCHVIFAVTEGANKVQAFEDQARGQREPQNRHCSIHSNGDR
jgi:hypothetical protein